MKFSCVATVLAGTLLFVGCGTQQSGGVAVVDLDRVANELGRSTVMLQQLQLQQNGLNQKLAAVKTSLEAQLNEKIEELPEEPSEEETANFLKLKRNARIQLAGYKQKASNSLGQLKNSAIQGFRSEAMPAAREVAKERGLSVVLTSNDAVVFTFDDAVDITDEVIARLAQNQPSQPAAQAPLKPTPAPAQAKAPAKPKATAEKPADTK